jgi:hypothetical protein
MTTVAKINDKFVEIVRVVNGVGFSHDKGWVLLNYPLDKPYHKRDARWVPITTRFDWIKTFKF